MQSAPPVPVRGSSWGIYTHVFLHTQTANMSHGSEEEEGEELVCEGMRHPFQSKEGRIFAYLWGIEVVCGVYALAPLLPFPLRWLIMQESFTGTPENKRWPLCVRASLHDMVSLDVIN